MAHSLLLFAWLNSVLSREQIHIHVRTFVHFAQHADAFRYGEEKKNRIAESKRNYYASAVTPSSSKSSAFHFLYISISISCMHFFVNVYVPRMDGNNISHCIFLLFFVCSCVSVLCASHALSLLIVLVSALNTHSELVHFIFIHLQILYFHWCTIWLFSQPFSWLVTWNSVNLLAHIESTPSRIGSLPQPKCPWENRQPTQQTQTSLSNAQHIMVFQTNMKPKRKWWAHNASKPTHQFINI